MTMPQLISQTKKMKPPIWTVVWCDASAITKLINKGMDLKQRSLYFNETILHYWAGEDYVCNVTKADISSYQEDALGVVKLLVEKGADLLAPDLWGLTPLLKAANGRYRRDRLNLKVLDFLLEREEYSRVEKIEAMELVGAVILQNEKNASFFHKAFEYWRKAFQLRQRNGEGSGSIEKPRLNPKNVQTTEWNTSAELEFVIEHPDEFLIQSFLVRLRIFSSNKWGAAYFLFSSNLLHDIFEQLRNQHRFVEIFDIIWTTLETLFDRPDLQENDNVQCQICGVVKLLIDIFTFLNKDFPDFRTEDIIKTMLYYIGLSAEFNCPISSDLIPFVRILSHLPQLSLKKYATETLSKVRGQFGQNLLHDAFGIAASSDANLYATVRLLLYAGCDPNAIDRYGNTPLHCLANYNQRYFKNDLNTIAILLLDFGAQLSRKDANGKTAVDLLIRNNKIGLHYNMEQEIDWKLPDWCTELPTLACLSARVIRCSRIPYLELPVHLIPIIEKHNPTL